MMVPHSLKKAVRRLRRRFLKKYDEELAFWRSRWEIDNGTFQNAHYRRLMLAMAEESTPEFLEGGVVADFGCGPRGSLAWAEPAMVRIGIDVLADRYADEFKDNIVSHGMIYVKSTENVIPIASNSVDVIFTINAMDHVNKFSTMCDEVIRVLKPDGLFIGSFNLEEAATPCEPQRLNEQIIREHLLDKLDIQSYRTSRRGPKDDLYRPFIDGTYSYQKGEIGFLWVKARKSAKVQTAPSGNLVQPAQSSQ